MRILFIIAKQPIFAIIRVFFFCVMNHAYRAPRAPGQVHQANQLNSLGLLNNSHEHDEGVLPVALFGGLETTFPPIASCFIQDGNKLLIFLVHFLRPPIEDVPQCSFFAGRGMPTMII